MYRFDRVLLAPTPTDLGQTLAEASSAANSGGRSRLLPWPPADFAAFLTHWSAIPEGQRQWTGPNTTRIGRRGDARSAVAVVWWSDPLRRQHCRIVAGRVETGSQVECDLLTSDSNPYHQGPPFPRLWRVYPDDLYLRQQGGEWQLWAACRCGAVGTPAELGWMGPWCAACHDRAEEGRPLTRPDVCRPVVYPGHPFSVGNLAFASEGRTLLAQVDCYPEVWAWNTITGQLAKRLFPGRAKDTSSKGLTVTADGQRAALCVNGRVQTWSVVSGHDGPALYASLDDSGSSPVSLAFSPDGALLASASRWQSWSDGMQVSLYDAASGTRLRELELDDQRCSPGERCLAFFPDGRTLALGWDRPMVRLWDVASGRELYGLPGKGSGAATIAISPDGKTLAGGSAWGNAGLRLWDLASRRVRASFPASITALAFSPDSRVLATAEYESLVLRDGASGGQLAAFRWHQGSIDAVAFTPDGRWLATGGKEDRVKLWPVDILLSRMEASPHSPTPG